MTDSDTGKVRVNVRLPVGVVNAGLKMGMRFAPQVEGLDLDSLSTMINSGEIGTIDGMYVSGPPVNQSINAPPLLIGLPESNQPT